MSAERRSSTSSLEPPKRREAEVEDPGAHELETSDSDDHFSDAQSAPSNSSSAGAASPVPRTRVEKVDDEPSHGQVPGTEAYDRRTSDAEPDEIAVVAQSEGSRSQSTSRATSPIPKTVVDKSEDAPDATIQQHDDELHQADASPDMIREPDGTAEANPLPPQSPKVSEDITDDNNSVSSSPKTTVLQQRRKSSAASKTLNPVRGSDDDGNEEEDDDDFGDDFDDFEEGDEDADFGDWAEEDVATPMPAPQPQSSLPSFPILNLDGLDSESILGATEPYLDALYPPDIQDLPVLPSPPKDNPIFFNPRSASLWSQLAAPPPLQPPDWIRSRIRRLFLVSLGVPVDLDEILPASKQKKLVLPSVNGSQRNSTDSRSVSRLRKTDANNSTVSVDSQGKEKSSGTSRRKGPPEAPELDLVTGRQLCTTTEEALGGMTDDELREHVKKLQDIEAVAKAVLDYWTKRTDEKIGDREAFEGVIENLVKHARKTRK